MNTIYTHRALECTITHFTSAHIQRRHQGPFYNSQWRRDEESVVDELSEHTDEDGHIAPIWDQNGNAIPTFQRRPIPNAQPAATFVNHAGIKRLFQPQLADPNQIHLNKTVDTYTFGLLPGVGSIQTRQPCPSFVPVYKKINSKVGRDVNDPDDSEDYSEDEEPSIGDTGFRDTAAPPPRHHRKPVVASDVQIYNNLSHSLSPRANQHAALLGQVSAAMSGFWARTPKDKSKAVVTENKIMHHLPYEMLETKINAGSVPTALRFEQVFTIDMDDVLPGHQNGQ